MSCQAQMRKRLHDGSFETKRCDLSATVLDRLTSPHCSTSCPLYSSQTNLAGWMLRTTLLLPEPKIARSRSGFKIEPSKSKKAWLASRGFMSQQIRRPGSAILQRKRISSLPYSVEKFG